MNLPQLHYTSAAPGPDGSGFRFTAVSPGVPQTVLEEAARVLGYEPPRTAPARPGEAELARFPVAFSHTRLADGSFLLSRAVYTGTDYSGRWGNFHAHAVHLPSGARLPDGLLPFEVADAPEWEAATPSDPVPAPLERFSADRQRLQEGLARFAADRAPWLAAVLADLRALALDPAAPRVVLVEPDTADVVRWLALAGTVLPPEAASRLTFASYSRRPQQAGQQVIGVLPEEAATLAALGRDRRYRVHHCTGQPPAAADAAVTSALDAALDAEADADPWAGICARIWLADRSEVFAQAALLPPEDDRFAAGPLAAAALASGVALDAPGRMAACAWAGAHHRALAPEQLDRLVRRLCEPGAERGPDESRALARLHDALDEVPVQLTSLVLVLAARLPELPLPAVDGLTPSREHRARLAAELSEVLPQAVATAVPRDPGRALELLGVAELMGMDLPDVPAQLAGPVTDRLLAERGRVPSASAEPLFDALEQRPPLLYAVRRRLDALAAEDPVGFADALGRSTFDVDVLPEEAAGLPHLAMCLAELEDRDRMAGLRVLLQQVGAGDSDRPVDPALLGTAMALVWERDRATAEEQQALLAEYGPQALAIAGTVGPQAEEVREPSPRDPGVPDGAPGAPGAPGTPDVPGTPAAPGRFGRLGKLLGGRGPGRGDGGRSV
ncbi:GTPase-associated protein 1-related protein [Streptacidiphilus carbonis]|uniref:GTPase-associated protein 1-related protein n=1 Tax=Streptacidiphilus carbonis TaxID=105422 RepID=UPI0006934328|nr:GTPase-associated protein 1-related protein [Streptacidiphilus carbonis]